MVSSLSKKELRLFCPYCGSLHVCEESPGGHRHHQCENCLCWFAESGYGGLGIREGEKSICS